MLKIIIINQAMEGERKTKVWDAAGGRKEDLCTERVELKNPGKCLRRRSLV